MSLCSHDGTPELADGGDAGDVAVDGRVRDVGDAGDVVDGRAAAVQAVAHPDGAETLRKERSVGRNCKPKHFLIITFSCSSCIDSIAGTR